MAGKRHKATATPGPLVSCIIIFLNEEHYLAEAIESVVAQTYPNWELLLVDDGSTDGSEAISRDYCARFPGKIRYLTHDGRQNRGMSASRNLGLREARGEYAAFLDGDDWWFPDKLQRQIAIFVDHPQAIMVCGATIYWHSWNDGRDEADRTILVGDWMSGDGKVIHELEQDRIYQPAELLRRLYPLGKGATASSSGNIFRRDAALALGGYDEAFPGLFEDQVFRAKFYLHGPIYVSSEIFDRYRQHPESCVYVTRKAGRNEGAKRQYLDWLSKYLDDVGHHDGKARSLLRRQLLRFRYPVVGKALTRVERLAKRAAAIPRSLSRLAFSARSR